MGGRGVMITKEAREALLADTKEAQEAGARISQIEKILGLSCRSLQRWNHNDIDKRPFAKQTSPKALSQEERDLILKTCNLDEFKDMTPNKIVPILAQRGTYIASESMFYKVLKENKQLKHRSNSKEPKKIVEPKTLVATGPNQLLSWDITYMRTSIKGVFFYLYLFMDVYSRKIVGWRIEDEESGDYAKQTVEQICLGNNLEGIFLHSDNGGPMTCGTILATMQYLGITASYSRPSVSNDNPYSESLFKTLKYKPGYPKNFETIEEARNWVEEFVKWYNTEHLHSGIKFVTPEQRHNGDDKDILAKRDATYQAAKKMNPKRWTRTTRNWTYIDKVKLKGSARRIQPLKNAS